jgi:outer membrane protein W
MRRNLVAAGLLSLCAFTVSADDLRQGSKQLSLFVTDPSFTESSSTGSNVSGGTGLAFSYVFARQWSAQLSVAAQEHKEVITRFTTILVDPQTGTTVFAPVTTVEKVHTYPVELLARYHFLNGSRWTPFLGAGVRYVQAPDGAYGLPAAIPPPTIGGPPTFFSNGPTYHDRTSAEVAGGVALRITPAVSLDIEARRLLRSEGVRYDPINRAVIGVSWRF